MCISTFLSSRALIFASSCAPFPETFLFLHFSFHINVGVWIYYDKASALSRAIVAHRSTKKEYTTIMKKIFFPIAALTLAMVCATGCKDKSSASSEGKNGKDSTEAAANKKDDKCATPDERFKRMAELEKERYMLNYEIDAELLKKATTLSKEEFIAYYKEYCDARYRSTEESIEWQNELRSKYEELERKKSNSEKYNTLMSCREIQALDAKLNRQIDALYAYASESTMEPMDSLAKDTAAVEAEVTAVEYAE